MDVALTERTPTVEMGEIYGLVRSTRWDCGDLTESSLELLTGLKTYHPLTYEARRDISEIAAEGRAVHLLCVRPHAGIAGNERADELARRAAFTKNTETDYDQFPLSQAKKMISAAILEEWQI
ncbi:hypothetical protein EVAR_52255_1 [Eumeta japonica]|uniref:Uncharacterized protein n=1 Tax=Eumeta variegata TaxID=151549 RepID=A0A4C1YTD7_EUMVA|nr:hypothetical protein EVAR_52255_1 [Eumeta japonica]